MRSTKICKIEGCTNLRVNGAFMCADHLGEKRRCEGLVRTYDDHTGEILSERRCKRSASPGNTTCAQHGALSPKARSSAAKANTLTAMQRFVKPYDGPVDPFTAFEGEYRRTFGRIIWLDDQIANLADDALVWGKSKEEHISATEFAGTNTTYEARINVFEDMLRWERKHLLELNKVAFKMNIEGQRLSMMREYIEGTYAATVNLLKSLGLDTASPEVRDRLRRMFESQVSPAPASPQPVAKALER